MSIFLKIDRFGAEPRLLQVRGLFAEIGEDDHEILTGNSPSTVFFSLYSINDRYLLKTNLPLLCNDQKMEKDQQLWLENETAFTIGDYQITAVCCSSTAEALARSSTTVADLTPEISILENLPQLIIKVANLSQTFPLYPALELVVGSDPEVSIMIDLVELSARHFALTNISSNPETPKVLLRPLEGSVIANGVAVKDEITLGENTKIVLEPSGLELQLTFPK